MIFQLRGPSLSIILLLSTIKVSAQETVYWANGNRFSSRLTEANDEYVFYNSLQDGKTERYTYRRDNVLIVFNAQGMYLMVSDISTNSAISKEQLNRFYSLPGLGKDLLLKAVPLKLIPCTIRYSSEEVINYITDDGRSGSINRKELAAIIYSNGKHSFTMPAPEAIPLLASIAPEIERLIPLGIRPKDVPSSKVETGDAGSESIAVSGTKDEFQVSPTETTSLVLTGRELNAYRSKSLQKVDEFVAFLNVITDKNAGSIQRDKAVEQALKLFLPETIIDVSSKDKSGTRKYPIAIYLNRLKLLPYNSAKIEWNEVSFIKELVQEEDGNYYGTISGQQTFTGYGPNGRSVAYSDVTQKNVKVKLQHYQKDVGGEKKTEWEVLLGNIGISVD